MLSWASQPSLLLKNVFNLLLRSHAHPGTKKRETRWRTRMKGSPSFYIAPSHFQTQTAGSGVLPCLLGEPVGALIPPMPSQGLPLLFCPQRHRKLAKAEIRIIKEAWPKLLPKMTIEKRTQKSGDTRNLLQVGLAPLVFVTMRH